MNKSPLAHATETAQLTRNRPRCHARIKLAVCERCGTTRGEDLIAEMYEKDDGEYFRFVCLKCVVL